MAAAAAMLALSKRTNVGSWCQTSMAEVMIDKHWRQRGRGRMREREGGNNRGGQQQQCLSSSNQEAKRKHKNNTTISHQNKGGGHDWLLEKVPMFQG